MKPGVLGGLEHLVERAKLPWQVLVDLLPVHLLKTENVRTQRYELWTQYPDALRERRNEPRTSVQALHVERHTPRRCRRPPCARTLPPTARQRWGTHRRPGRHVSDGVDSGVPDNLMSYVRTGAQAFLDHVQLERIPSFADASERAAGSPTSECPAGSRDDSSGPRRSSTLLRLRELLEEARCFSRTRGRALHRRSRRRDRRR